MSLFHVSSFLSLFVVCLYSVQLVILLRSYFSSKHTHWSAIQFCIQFFVSLIWSSCCCFHCQPDDWYFSSFVGCIGVCFLFKSLDPHSRVARNLTLLQKRTKYIVREFNLFHVRFIDEFRKVMKIANNWAHMLGHSIRIPQCQRYCFECRTVCRIDWNHYLIDNISIGRETNFFNCHVCVCVHSLAS